MKTRLYITIALLIATIAAAFGLPKPKYESPDILGKLKIPHTMTDWRSVDFKDNANNKQDDRYNFISDIFARLYGTRYGESLLFLVLDAGNFHHPKVCFGSSGFRIDELEDKEFVLPDRKIKGKVLFTEKGDRGFLLVFWISINKKQVDWTEQKFLQLWYSLFNKEKVGLMMRLDIPTTEDRIDPSLKLAQEFLTDIYKDLPEEDRDYIFGKSRE